MGSVGLFFIRAWCLAAALLGLVGPVAAQHAGLRTMVVPGADPITVALFYPTATPARTVSMGPWQPVVAPGAPVAASPLRGLILISHGTGGAEMGHFNLAMRLAAEGYLVAALRHPGDHWQDRSLVASGRYFGERPRQVSRVLDALLAHAEWAPRIPAGRIGAVGHSAGGYTVLALAGARAAPARVAQHCRAVPQDGVFCALGRWSGAQASTAGAGAPPDGDEVSVADPRIRAVVALAPLAVVLTPESLAAIMVPVHVVLAGQDTVLQARYHGQLLAAHLRGAHVGTVPQAGHFAFMAPSVMPLPSDAGDAAADPPGFDRKAYHAVLEREVVAFFAARLP